MNMENIYRDYISGNRVEFGLVVGLVVGLLLGLAVKPTVIENNNQKTIEEKVIDQRERSVTSNEICSSIYGADHGYGDGLANVNCYYNGTYYSLGARDLAKALNSSYAIGDY